MPSRLEGFGIVFLEPMACGKPVVAGNQDGSVEALSGGELGVLINPDSVPEIANALSTILQKRHPLLILQQPQQLRARVIDAYGYERFLKHVARYLTEMGLASDGGVDQECPLRISLEECQR